MVADTEWLTTQDAAVSLRFTRKTIASWCARGVFPGAQKFPNDSPRSEWRIPPSAVEAVRRRQAELDPLPRTRLDALMDAAMKRRVA